MNLDDVSAIAAGDPGGALSAAEGAARQWDEAIARARAAERLPGAAGLDSILFCGMGGSGIAGDVLAAVAAPAAPVPVAVVKGYVIPAWVGERTLVICASYSGNTEETLSCFDDALKRRARVVTITTGGTLAGLAQEYGLANVSPVEGLQPRAALPSLAASALVLAERIGLVPDLSEALDETSEALAAVAAELGRDRPGNRAKELAADLDGKVAHVWGQDGPLAVAAMRWRCQLNENAKVPASSAALPELDHNELVGYDPGLPVLADTALVVLRSPGEHPRLTLRVEATLDAMASSVGLVRQVEASGDSAMARLMTSSLVGDFTSIYLALLRGVDPTPVDVITTLKKRLA